MRRMSVQTRVSIDIQRIRREKNLSQEEVAHRADIHQTYLSGVETGKRNPSILVVERIAKALGVDVSEVVRGI
ncbi:helix-turn-helix domain-containing protein [Oceanicella actignis]|uniref:DNA-binding transcriptional regulator, XRE-family HTH domain n=1 Tax=Oceanicella actignis TaxID=1189325 RepID=A0A1M7RX89_9RHOB|nr:helix-turn-helix transcriptional regulator [Oceanicella actignis]SES98455.1 DNA-binding transcriptional regulator, XRE-family HTH domain [Oceanicella actignis]SHN50957.1 DNA-binding transcriptional regulator, XRE-family HTH domain [Oceanicella actignis]